MATKENPGSYDCYAKLESDEPYFVLRGTDIDAPKIIELWAYNYRLRKESSGGLDTRAQAKIKEAIKVAEEMMTWRTQYVERKKAEVSASTNIGDGFAVPSQYVSGLIKP